MKSMEIRRNELLSDVADWAADVARQFNLTPDQAEQIGAAVADRLAEEWAGQVISFPKDAAYKLAHRDVEVLRAKLAGASFAELMRTYRMTERGLRKLLKRAELRFGHDLRQRALFSSDSSGPADCS